MHGPEIAAASFIGSTPTVLLDAHLKDAPNESPTWLQFIVVTMVTWQYY